jgi:hypothetical protein
VRDPDHGAGSAAHRPGACPGPSRPQPDRRVPSER